MDDITKRLELAHVELKKNSISKPSLEKELVTKMFMKVDLMPRSSL